MSSNTNNKNTIVFGDFQDVEEQQGGVGILLGEGGTIGSDEGRNQRARSLEDGVFGEVSDVLGDVPFSSYDLQQSSSGRNTLNGNRMAKNKPEIVPEYKSAEEEEEEEDVVVTGVTDAVMTMGVQQEHQQQKQQGLFGGLSPSARSSTRGQPPHAYTATTNEIEQQQQEEESYDSYPWYTIRRYRGYFNVNTGDVLERIYRSVMLFFKGDFIDYLGDTPDLYGPFWIASTLIFISAAAGNTASYIAYHRHGDEPSSSTGWYYDVDKVGGSMGLFYGYVGVCGLIVYGVLRYLGGKDSRVGLATIWCIYGYALVSYIPMAALCVIPLNIVRWVCVSIATAISGVFLIRSLYPYILAALSQQENASIRSIPLPVFLVGSMATAHAVLGLALKLYFFNY
jgi:hypothetical protein